MVVASRGRHIHGPFRVWDDPPRVSSPLGTGELRKGNPYPYSDVVVDPLAEFLPRKREEGTKGSNKGMLGLVVSASPTEELPKLMERGSGWMYERGATHVETKTDGRDVKVEKLGAGKG